MAIVLIAAPEHRASLNLYAHQVNAFDGNVSIADLFASQAALVLDLTDTIQHLHQAVGSRAIIGQAVGVLMERRGWDRREAFDRLVEQSQSSNVRLRLVADQVVHGAEPKTSPPPQPPPQPPAADE